jgi:PIN domain nuclease of toxin-antitoxin system
MRKSYVLDACALIALVREEGSAEAVAEDAVAVKEGV